MVLEKAGNNASGRVYPGITKKVDAMQLNGFVKAKGMELFGTYEAAQGRSKNETEERKVNQVAIDAVYRFGNEENLFLGVQYKTINVIRNILLKGGYIRQKLKDLPEPDLRNGDEFNGYVVLAVVGF